MPARASKASVRYASVIRLRAASAVRTYLELHSAVWPSVEATITACNIRNYTIWLHGDTARSASYEYIGDDHDADTAGHDGSRPGDAALVGG